MTAFKFSVKENIATVVFDLEGEKVNKLSTPVMDEFDKLLDKLGSDKNIKAIIIASAKPNVFIAGADIKEIAGITDPAKGAEKAASGQNILFKLEELAPFTIAAIDGACLGGGLELALACDFRVVTDNPKTQLGAPEVNLGILPAFGGTQRLPKLIGLQEGLGLILSGRSVDGLKAFKLGLADKLVPKELIDEKVLEFTKGIIKANKEPSARRKPRGLAGWIFEKTLFGRAIVYLLAKKNVLKQTKGFYPAPLKALEAVKTGYGRSGRKGYRTEARYLGELSVTETCKNLIQIFFSGEEIKKYSGVEGSTLNPRDITKAGLLGAGFMGGGIAQLLAYHDVSVRMKDINWQAVATGVNTVSGLFRGLVKRRKLKKHEAALKFELISGTIDYKGFKHVDVVLEAVLEDMEVKKRVLKELAGNLNPEALIMSNTSSLSISEIAKAAPHPEKVIGFHFFSPVHRMPLIEIIPGKQTSEQTIIDTVAFAKKLGKTPIVVQECPGFLVNRILFPYLNEAAHLIEEGIPLTRIDDAALSFGMPIGPLALADEIGLPVCFKVAKILEEGFSGQPRAKIADIFHKMAELKLLGKKSSAGFYIYKGKERSGPNPVLKKYVPSRPKNDLTTSELTDRLILIMLNEAALCMQEKIITDPKYLDLALIFGIGFPPFLGGLLKYADKVGIKNIVNKLEALVLKHGKRFEPAPLLKQMADAGNRFYK